MSNLKFKPGDKVVVISDRYKYYGVEKGTQVKILKYDTYGWYLARASSTKRVYVNARGIKSVDDYKASKSASDIFNRLKAEIDNEIQSR